MMFEKLTFMKPNIFINLVLLLNFSILLMFCNNLEEENCCFFSENEYLKLLLTKAFKQAEYIKSTDEIQVNFLGVEGESKVNEPLKKGEAISATSKFSIVKYNFYTDDWPINETKYFDDILITRVGGANSEIGVTNITYDTQKKLLSDLKYRMKNEGMSKDRHDKYAERYKRKASGGMLHVFLTRNDFDSANMDYYEVHIYNKKGYEIFHQVYSNQIPKTYAEEPDYMWKNEGKMMIMPDLYLPVTIEVIDMSGEENVNHQFRIEKKLKK
jgi:hypothetical protein